MSDAEQRPKVEVETVRPFNELFDALDEAGFDAERRAPQEQRGVRSVVEAIVIYLLGKAADPMVDRLTDIVRGWVDEWLRPYLRKQKTRPSAVPPIKIYGPDGEVLAEVEVDE